MSEKEYLEKVVAKYNENKEDETLTGVEKVLLQNVEVVEKESATIVEEYNKLREELAKVQDRMKVLSEQLVKNQGKTDGLISSLLALREKETEESA